MFHSTLEQWLAFYTVVTAGGYAQAAQQLSKSQSAISHAVAKLQQQMAVRLFVVKGRKAVLTEPGQRLFRHAEALLLQAQALEQTAQSLARGWEAEVRVAAEVIFPAEHLVACLAEFSQITQTTRIQIVETVLSGAQDALLAGDIDVAIAPRVPVGFLGDFLTRIRLLPVAASNHPLSTSQEPLSQQDLTAYRHVVVRDSGSGSFGETLWLDADQRWTVSHIATSIKIVEQGLGFSWLPEHLIQAQLKNGSLIPLKLQHGQQRFADLYLIYGKSVDLAPAAHKLGELLLARCGEP